MCEVAIRTHLTSQRLPGLLKDSTERQTAGAPEEAAELRLSELLAEDVPGASKLSSSMLKPKRLMIIGCTWLHHSKIVL